MDPNDLNGGLLASLSSGWLRELQGVDNLGELRGAPWAAAELARDASGFSWALARSLGERSRACARLARFCDSGFCPYKA